MPLANGEAFGQIKNKIKKRRDKMARILRVLTFEKDKEGRNFIHDIFEFDLDANRKRGRLKKRPTNSLWKQWNE